MKRASWMSAWLVCLALVHGQVRADDAPPAENAAESAKEQPLLDLNRATLVELTALPGIGTKRAQAILDYREAHGGFRNVAQLLHIKGVGRAMLRKLKPLVTVGESPHEEEETARGT